jgi:nicotinamide riboside kinase
MSKKKIVIIGSPASGKTMVCSILQGLTTKNAVTFIEEAASRFFNTISFKALEKLSPVELQNRIFNFQLAMELEAEKSEPKIIICDRGAADSYVYCSESQAFEATHSTMDVLLSRYSAVIILEGAASNFQNDTQTMRLENDYETVTKLAHKSDEVWSKHEVCFRVGQQETVEKKAMIVASIINELIGEKVFNIAPLLV